MKGTYAVDHNGRNCSYFIYDPCMYVHPDNIKCLRMKRPTTLETNLENISKGTLKKMIRFHLFHRTDKSTLNLHTVETFETYLPTFNLIKVCGLFYVDNAFSFLLDRTYIAY